MDSVTPTQWQQKSRQQCKGNGNSNGGNDGESDNDSNGGDSNKDDGDGNGWRTGDGRRDGNMMATVAMGSVTAHNW